MGVRLGMKIIIFGGTGGMGQKVVKELCSYAEIAQVTVAARNAAKFAELKKQVPAHRKLEFLACNMKKRSFPIIKRV